MEEERKILKKNQHPDMLQYITKPKQLKQCRNGSEKDRDHDNSLESLEIYPYMHEAANLVTEPTLRSRERLFDTWCLLSKEK